MRVLLLLLLIISLVVIFTYLGMFYESYMLRSITRSLGDYFRRVLLLLIISLVVIFPYSGMLYESYMLRSNTRSLGDDVRAVQDSKEDYVPNCTMYYNPFRFWEDRDEQRYRYRNSKLLCED